MASENAIQKAQAQTTNVEVTGDENSLQRPSTGWSYRPNVDIFELPEEFRITADLPGASSDTIDLSFESSVLTLNAPVVPREEQAVSALVREYGVGDFHRQFEIHEAVDPEKISAQFTNGTLTVHLPKAATARRRKVNVSN